MNGFGVSSAVVAKAFPGARLVKGFNHLKGTGIRVNVLSPGPTAAWRNSDAGSTPGGIALGVGLSLTKRFEPGMDEIVRSFSPVGR